MWVFCPLRYPLSKSNIRWEILTYILYQYLCKRTKFRNMIRILYREITCCKFVGKKLVCQVFFWLPIKILEHSFLHCFVSENFKEKTSHLHLSSSASHPFSNQFPSSNDFPVLLSLVYLFYFKLPPTPSAYFQSFQSSYQVSPFQFNFY